MDELDVTELLKKLKRRQDIFDDKQDELLKDIIDDTIAHYLAIVGRLSGVSINAVPSKHSFMILGVASKRYIRRGSEGIETERVDQYQAVYTDKDFNEYMDILDSVYTDVDEVDRGKGKVTFY